MSAKELCRRCVRVCVCVSVFQRERVQVVLYPWWQCVLFSWFPSLHKWKCCQWFTFYVTRSLIIRWLTGPSCEVKVFSCKSWKIFTQERGAVSKIWLKFEGHSNKWGAEYLLTIKQRVPVCLPAVCYLLHTWQGVAGDPRKPGVEFGAIWTRDVFNKKNLGINSEYHSVQRRWCGFNSLASWHCSHAIPLSWSHGEADVNKMEITVVQQLAEVTQKLTKAKGYISLEELGDKVNSGCLFFSEN